jgi:hypothetical protein
MASERDRKRASELPIWDQVKASFTGGYNAEGAAQKAVEERDAQAMREALKRRRAQGASS